VEKYSRAGQATDNNKEERMRFACWITKAAETHTLRICNNYSFSTTTMVIRSVSQCYVKRTLPVLFNK
jgi:hypothetical protein